MSEIMVSVCVLSYNHEKYLRDCLEGIVMQRTTFPIEAWVHDDASTDSSQDIIREYQQRYPDVINPILQTENQYSKHESSILAKFVFPKCRGKYIAYCEGDDYWTDPLKLQKQVDFLESHLEYEVCAHETIFKDKSGKEILCSDYENRLLLSTKKQDYTLEEILKGNLYHISSMMFRNYDIRIPSWSGKMSAGDMVLFRVLGEKGKLHILSDCMSVYRDHSDSVTNTCAEFQSEMEHYKKIVIPILRLLNRFWNRKYQDIIYPIISQYYSECACIYLRKSTRDVKLFVQMF